MTQTSITCKIFSLTSSEKKKHTFRNLFTHFVRDVHFVGMYPVQDSDIYRIRLSVPEFIAVGH